MSIMHTFTGDHVIDIDDYEELAKQSDTFNFESEMQKRIRLPLIHKIQPKMHDKDEKAHEPSMFSIGPYHYRSPSTMFMQKTKWGYVDYILSLNPQKKLSDYIEAMREIETRTRECYADQIDMDSSEFLKMMLLDGCFILVTICGAEGVISMENHGEYPRGIRMLHDTFLMADILLLENQIPFFVVMKIYELVRDGNNATYLRTKNIVKSVEDLIISSYPKGIHESNRPKNFHHLLHLCHMYFRPTRIQVTSNKNNPRPRFFHRFLELHNAIFNKNKTVSSFDDDLEILESGRQIIGWRRAIEYHKAGIEFKKRKLGSENPHSLLDIVFCNGDIEIPCLTIDSNTYCFFRNLVEFEQTCPEFGNPVTTYVVLFSRLISKAEDMSLLTKTGIIVNQLNSDAEVFDIFASLSKSVAFDFNGNYCLRPLYHAMETHYESQRSFTSRIHEWMKSKGV